ncbi:phage holin family protein [Streptomyces sp. BR123]|uniref:phage holin family protein n=1 Tax=Streptomyces sp. BR123 TaxID=2749828 RepID=UPI002811877A|nr:phage holin family protein [Streptomyces sp. BR123]
MATAYQERPMRPAPPHRQVAEPSIGDLVEAIGQDVSGLVRTEIELAKAELTQEFAKAGKAGGMLGGAGYAGHMVMLFGSLTAVFAMANVINIAWAALIVTALWAAVGAALYVSGRAGWRNVHLKPEQTVESLKEDARWARHPTS